MVKVTTDNSSSSKFNKIGIIIGIVTFGLFIILKVSNKLNSSSSESGQVQSILSKEEHMLTLEAWKSIADYRAQEFFECTKDLDNDSSKWYLYENCATSYRNDWVSYRDGLDYRANLNDEQREVAKDYWYKTQDEIIEKVSKLKNENDSRLRPKRE